VDCCDLTRQWFVVKRRSGQVPGPEIFLRGLRYKRWTNLAKTLLYLSRLGFLQFGLSQFTNVGLSRRAKEGRMMEWSRGLKCPPSALYTWHSLH
jgi:hypothetical protein